ncbi:MAG: homocysteine S-methyltransferase family protein [Anaerotignum sp.]
MWQALSKKSKTTAQNLSSYTPTAGKNDPVTKTWHGNKDGKCYCDFAAESIAAGEKIVGGCCRTTPENIREVAELARRK